jgi:hypothetical protein
MEVLMEEIILSLVFDLTAQLRDSGYTNEEIAEWPSIVAAGNFLGERHE